MVDSVCDIERMVIDTPALSRPLASAIRAKTLRPSPPVGSSMTITPAKPMIVASQRRQLTVSAKYRGRDGDENDLAEAERRDLRQRNVEQRHELRDLRTEGKQTS